MSEAELTSFNISFSLLSQERGDALQPAQRNFARTETELEGKNLLDTINLAKPQILLGLSSCGGLFTEEVRRVCCSVCTTGVYHRCVTVCVCLVTMYTTHRVYNSNTHVVYATSFLLLPPSSSFFLLPPSSFFPRWCGLWPI